MVGRGGNGGGWYCYAWSREMSNLSGSVSVFLSTVVRRGFSRSKSTHV